MPDDLDWITVRIEKCRKDHDSVTDAASVRMQDLLRGELSEQPLSATKPKPTTRPATDRADELAAEAARDRELLCERAVQLLARRARGEDLTFGEESVFAAIGLTGIDIETETGRAGRAQRLMEIAGKTAQYEGLKKVLKQDRETLVSESPKINSKSPACKRS